MYLTLADSGNRRLTIRGPPGVSHFLSAGKAFCENRQDSELRAAEINFSSPTDALLHDNLVSIQPVPILPATEPDPLVSGNGVARHQLSGGVSGDEDADEEEDADGEGDLRKAGAGVQARRESRSPKDRADQAKAKLEATFLLDAVETAASEAAAEARRASAPLAEGWREAIAPGGRVYYYNEARETTWVKPVVEEDAPPDE